MLKRVRTLFANIPRSPARLARYLKTQTLAPLISMVLAASSSPAVAKFEYQTRGQGKPLIILVPGLSGNNKTFTANGRDASLTDMMRDDKSTVLGERPLSEYATALLSFPSGCSDRLSINQIATGLATDLRDQAVWLNHPYIVLVGHSLGGLVIQEMLSVERDALNGVSLADRTAAVILLATPTNGSELADGMVSLMEKTVGSLTDCPLVRDLRSIGSNSYLQTLDSQFRRFLSRQGRQSTPHGRLQVSCFYETKPTLAGVIVPMDRSASLCDGERLAIAADHFEIAKPTSRDSTLYQRLRGRIAETDLRLKPIDRRNELSLSPTLQRRPNHYVQGKGYRTHHKTGWDACARLCQDDSRCKMIELYKPLVECNLYEHTRVDGRAGTADVGIKVGAVVTAEAPATRSYEKRRP